MGLTAKTLFIDDRGRITLPIEMRKGVDSYRVEMKGNGHLYLVPQTLVGTQDAQLLESLKSAVLEVKDGKTKPMPKEWIEE